MAANKGGRPQREFDKPQFEKLCGLLATEAEICGWFHTTDKTLSAWCNRTYGKGFSDVYKELSSSGKISLRRSQFRLAEKSAAMAIFLGKQYLGQRDNPDEEEREARIAALRARAGLDSDDDPEGVLLVDDLKRDYEDS